MSKVLSIRSGRWVSMLLVFMAMSMTGMAGTYQLPNGEVLKDPTRPAHWHSRKERIQSHSYRLSYILYSKHRRQAIINGRKVEEGDRIGPAKVLKIAKNSVTVEINGKVRKLGLKRGKVTKKVR